MLSEVSDEGSLTTRADEDSGRGSPRAAGNPCLIYVGSPEDGFVGAGTVLSLDRVRTIRFGRTDARTLEHDVHDDVLHVGIPLAWVSHTHAEITLRRAEDEDELDLRDLGSRNGVFVDGQRIRDTARFDYGSMLELGRSFWLIRDLPPGRRAGVQPELPGLARSANPILNETYRNLARLAQSDVSIFLLGETGTGKQATARAIHRLSGRTGSFVPSNLAAVSPDQIGVVVEGHGPGAIRGGNDPRAGLFELADGGTLFLHELADASEHAQAKIVAALDAGAVTRVGEAQPRPFDVRVIASSLHDLRSRAEAGRFRGDLYGRLSGYAAVIPPLRHRREDLGLLTRTILGELKTETGGISTSAFRRLTAHPWPFNLRELRQALSTAAVLAGAGVQIEARILDDLLHQRSGTSPETILALRERIVSELAVHRGDTRSVASVLELEHSELHRWLERFELRPSAFADDG